MITPLAHLSYVALSTTDVDRSVDFYVNTLGLTEVDRVDGRAYLRCWGDPYRYSLVIVPGEETALYEMAWRTKSREMLDEADARDRKSTPHNSSHMAI